MVYIKVNTIVAEKRPYGYSCNRVTVRSLKSFDIICYYQTGIPAGPSPDSCGRVPCGDGRWES